MYGATINASITYDPNADEAAPAAGGVGVTSVDGVGYTLEIAHESGVSVGGGIEEIDNATASGSDEDSSTVYIKYAMGPLSAAYQEAYQNSKNGTEDISAEFWSVAYTAGDLSFSYAESKYVNEGMSAATASVSRELEAIQASYTMGSMTLAGAIAETANAGGTAGNKYEETELSVSFAF